MLLQKSRVEARPPLIGSWVSSQLDPFRPAFRLDRPLSRKADLAFPVSLDVFWNAIIADYLSAEN